MHQRWFSCFLTATLMSACASTVTPTYDDAARWPDVSADRVSIVDASPTPGCDAGIQWLDPITDPPLPIAASPAPAITSLSSGRFALFSWSPTVGAIARFVPNAGPWSPDARVVAPWAGTPMPPVNVVQRLFVGESRTGPMFGMIGNGPPGIVWTEGPTPAGAWPTPTTLDASLPQIGDLAFLDDRVVVSLWDLVIGRGAVSGLVIVNVDRSTGTLIDRQVWESGSWSDGFYNVSSGPRLVRDGDRVVALRPGLNQPGSSGPLTLFDGPSAGVPIASGHGVRGAAGAGHRIWVMQQSDAHPRLQLGFVESGVATRGVWSSDRAPLGDGREEFDVAPASDGAVLAYLEAGDLVVTVVDRNGGVRTSGSLPVHLIAGRLAAVRLAAASDGTFAVVWSSVDVAHPLDVAPSGGLVRFRVCGE